MPVHRRTCSLVSLSVLCGLLTACPPLSTAEAANGEEISEMRKPAARDLILAVHPGSDAIDEQIRKAQERLRAHGISGAAVLKLGRLYISKARLTDDPGCYYLAE